MTNADTNTAYDQYSQYGVSEYITNFYGKLYNLKQLKGVTIAFEKLFTDEKLFVYCRTSEREDFLLLCELDKNFIANSDMRYDASLKTLERAPGNNGIRQQVYTVVQLPESLGGQNFPEFYEIQFYFYSIKGFCVTDAWFQYEYIERDVLQ